MTEQTPEVVRAFPGGRLTSNAGLMAKARQNLRGKWGFGVLVTLLYFLVSAVPSGFPKTGWIIGLIINGPLSLGMAILYLRFVRMGEAAYEQVFHGFKWFKTALITYLLMVLYIILWALLFIIPGVVAAFSYSMTFFILADNPNLTPSEALLKSKQLMNCHKLKLFYLACRFIPWAILSVLSFGIGFLWLIPYMYSTVAFFYEDITSQKRG